MARPTNHAFERAQRDRAKLAKREAKKASRQAAVAAKEGGTSAQEGEGQEGDAANEAAAPVDTAGKATPS